MAINIEDCEAYFHGEIRPIIFRVYTESGLPFDLIPDPKNEGRRAYCDIKNEEGKHLKFVEAEVISDEPAEKRFVCSWDTGDCAPSAYYRLQVWATCNISGKVNAEGDPIVEALLASEEITRYIKPTS